MDEFSLIERYLKPLATHQSALSLADDAAVLDVPSGYQLVITKDAAVSGVHFIGDEPAGLIARKILRVNLSDLAAMGATPMSYFLALMLPQGTDENWIAAFAQGLKADQQTFGIALAGGDTVATTGPISASITALGLVPAGTALTRGGAKVGDDIWVSGTIGDAVLGLQAIRNAWDEPYLIDRYHLPQPRVTLAEKLRGIATACMDISDGLVQDAGHMAKASGVKMEIYAERVPLSAEAQRHLHKQDATLEQLLTGGDDYELLFTASPTEAEKIYAFGVKVSKIGTVAEGEGVIAVQADGKVMELVRSGYRHFAINMMQNGKRDRVACA